MLFKSSFHLLRLSIGCFLAALAIKVFFIPNNLIDGGTVGLAMILSRIFGQQWLPILTILLTCPFAFLASKFIGRLFVVHTLVAGALFSIFLELLTHVIHHPFHGEAIEVVVIGGGILGVGIGIIMRSGACLDGTEILGLVANKRLGFTVGQVVFFCNILVYTFAGIVFKDWHPPIMSLIAYIVVVKTLDFVLVGLDETKSVLVISAKFKEIEKAVIHELGIGLTVMYGRGGFSGESREILYIITERLQLAELKDLIYSIDASAFMAIESLHEVSTGRHNTGAFKRPHHSQKMISWLPFKKS